MHSSFRVLDTSRQCKIHNPIEHKANGAEIQTLINSKGLTDRVITLRRVLTTRRLVIALLGDFSV